VAYNQAQAAVKEQEAFMAELLKDFKPYYQTIVSADVTHGINWFVEKEKLDMVVVIPKKHRLTEKLFSRSQTRELVYHTHVPVLCIHE
jgi:hypothetical protein